MPLTTVDTGVLTDGSVTTAKIADGAVSAAKLGSDAPGMTLLGTVSTTSGTTATLSNLTLTNYKAIYIVLNGVSATSAFAVVTNTTGTANSGTFLHTVLNQASGIATGFVWVDLLSGAFRSSVMNTSTTTDQSVVNTVAFSTATTSITFTPSAGSFDLGSITVYGVK